MRFLRVLLVMLTVSVSRISARRERARKENSPRKQAGKVTAKFDATVSKDGKTTTLSGADTTTVLINGE